MLARTTYKAWHHLVRSIITGIYLIDTYPDLSTDYRVNRLKSKIDEYLLLNKFASERFRKDFDKTLLPFEVKLIRMFYQHG